MIAAEPALHRRLSEPQLERALEAIADFTDLKSPFTLGHWRRVADLAAAAGPRGGLPADESGSSGAPGWGTTSAGWAWPTRSGTSRARSPAPGDAAAALRREARAGRLDGDAAAAVLAAAGHRVPRRRQGLAGLTARELEVLRLVARDCGRQGDRPRRLRAGLELGRARRADCGHALVRVPAPLYVVSGRMRVRMDDGGEVDLRQGDVASIPPGHDATVLGDEPCVTVDLGEEDGDYARPG